MRRTSRGVTSVRGHFRRGPVRRLRPDRRTARTVPLRDSLGRVHGRRRV